jgi:hypothetical protein
VAPRARRGRGPPTRAAPAVLRWRAVQWWWLPRYRSFLRLTATTLAIALASSVVTGALAAHVPERPR